MSRFFPYNNFLLLNNKVIIGGISFYCYTRGGGNCFFGGVEELYGGGWDQTRPTRPVCYTYATSTSSDVLETEQGENDKVTYLNHEYPGFYANSKLFQSFLKLSFTLQQYNKNLIIQLTKMNSLDNHSVTQNVRSYTAPVLSWLPMAMCWKVGQSWDTK